MNYKPWLASAALVCALGLAACATDESVDKKIAAEGARADGKVAAVASAQAQTDAQVAAEKSAIAGHDAKIAGLDKGVRDAMDRATAAGKLAEGKFLYSMVLSDDSVKFKSGKASLSPEGEARLNDLAAKLKTDNKNVFLEIQGHTDATGSAEANMRLGMERADAVRLFLNKQGVALNRMSSISYGGTSPVTDNKTKANRAQNRRVVVVVLD
jgi:outer membrane protein OmpA-like peptidoglycan-associated protein